MKNIVWIKQDLTQIKVTEMTDLHIHNVILMLQRDLYFHNYNGDVKVAVEIWIRVLKNEHLRRGGSTTSIELTEDEKKLITGRWWYCTDSCKDCKSTTNKVCRFSQINEYINCDSCGTLPKVISDNSGYAHVWCRYCNHILCPSCATEHHCIKKK